MEATKGQVIPAHALPAITREHLRNYAEASGDPNPIHLDDAAAKKAGLPGVIAHGMLIAGFVSERGVRFMQDELGGQYEVKQVQLRFRAMTFVGDVISVAGSVRKVSGSEVTLELQASKQTGEVVATGTLRFARRLA